LTFELCNTKIRVMEKSKVPSEVKSYFIGDLISAGVNFATNTVPNFITQTIPNAVGDLASQGLQGLYTNADKLLGGILPGGQALGQGYLGQLYTGADKMLGGYLPNIGGGAASGGLGYSPQYMAAQKAFNALPGPGGVGAGQVGTSFMGGPMSVSSVNTNVAPTMSNLDKLSMGLQGAGLIGALATGDKGTAQAAMMYPGQLAPGAGRTSSPLSQTIKQDPVMQSAGVGGSATGQDKNKTPGMKRVTAGTGESGVVGEIEETQKMIDELNEEIAKMVGGDVNEQSAMEKADRIKIDGTPLISISGNF
jgi:hypothetical protein